MRVDVLALDGVFDLGLSAILDVFQTANELIDATAMAVPRFALRTVGVRRNVTTSHGLRVPVQPVGDEPAELLVVPAIGYKMPGPLEEALRRPDVRDAARVLHRAAAGEGVVAAACIGTFVLAESGALQSHRATTTWWLAPLFRKRYPGVRLDESRMVVRSGRIVTSGAALGHVDLALHLVRGVSPNLASLVARYLIVDTRPSQSVYALSDHLVHADPVVERFEGWARERLSRGFSLDAAARSVGASKRTLSRHMRRVLGQTPLEYFQTLRVERAVHLLRTQDASVDQIAARVGYADGATLRALLRRKLGSGVREIRRRG